MPYYFNEHRHRYAVWTAARAVQRNFTVTNSDIRDAIEFADLRSFAEDEIEYGHNDFEAFHRACAVSMIGFFNSKGIPNVSYGRAAKIIAIYLKTSVVLCSKASCKKTEVVHPPLDRILLQKLATEVAGLGVLAKHSWTKFNEKEYWQVVELIREKFGAFNWQLEEFWEV